MFSSLQNGESHETLSAIGGNSVTPLSPILTTEQRLEIIETKIKRFEDSFFNAAAMLLENPLASAALPKQMKLQLREFLDERAAKQST
jgi:hypothetical protein